MNTPLLDFFLSRRSTPARMLGAPYPEAETLRSLLTAAARVPDHGKLVPWRFLVLEGAACRRLAAITRRIGAAQGQDADRLEKQAACFAGAGLIVAVVFSPKPSEKIPEAEQLMSTGAVCLSLVNAAEAAGFGANWLTGWMATDAAFLHAALGLTAPEIVAGFVHLGTPAGRTPDRPRPDIDAITTWIGA